MITVEQFAARYPDYSFDFTQAIKEQPRMYEMHILNALPQELQPSAPYWPGRRGRPNLNQTRTHSQCATCKKVLRNDFFHTPPSQMARNVIFSHCIACTQGHNAQRYASSVAQVSARRAAIWHYMAPRCVRCGFDTHMSAMDLHHSEQKEGVIAALVTALADNPEARQAEKLLKEARDCLPLCSNCHRLLHAGVLLDVDELSPLRYELVELLKRLNAM